MIEMFWEMETLIQMIYTDKIKVFWDVETLIQMFYAYYRGVLKVDLFMQMLVAFNRDILSGSRHINSDVLCRW